MALDSYITSDAFFPGAKTLRQDFNKAFEDPRAISSKRFVWDFWYQPEQYRHLRTPADAFFQKKVFDAFLLRLTRWGQQHLGCSSLSQPWLSYYVDGCFQNLHGDVPHGPFAYVYSLTLDPHSMQGGRTLLLQDSVLDFWGNLKVDRGFEQGEVFHRIENKFNRLVVFDPRIPHGVEEVRGVRDPLKSRVVIHGWFTEPTPFVIGALNQKAADRFLQAHLPALLKKVGVLEANGLLTLKIRISASGKVQRKQVVLDSLRCVSALEKKQWLRDLSNGLQDWKFPKSRASSELVLPLYFK